MVRILLAFFLSSSARAWAAPLETAARQPAENLQRAAIGLAVLAGIALLAYVAYRFSMRQDARRAEALTPRATPAPPRPVEEEEEEEELGAEESPAGAAAEEAEEAEEEAAPPAPSEPVAAPDLAAREKVGRERGRERKQEAPRRDLLEASYSLTQGMAKTRTEGFVGRLSRLFSGRKEIDLELLEQIEEVLYKADIGVRTTEKLISRLKEESLKTDFLDPGRVWSFLKVECERILAVQAGPLQFPAGRPLVVMVVGVNGVGKTTTIGKLGARFTAEGKKVLIAAGDTFRAAAVEQLEVWAERSGLELIKGRPDADPASVVFNAIQKGKKDGHDVVLADTAGRLHTKIPLMEELKKIHKVCGKAIDGAPDEVLLVLDSTNGQNAILQARQFSASIGLTGIILTKLDGTAKGGIILGISEELQLPIRYIGVGEKVGDLRPFVPAEFVEALFEQDEASAA